MRNEYLNFVVKFMEVWCSRTYSRHYKTFYGTFKNQRNFVTESEIYFKELMCTQYFEASTKYLHLLNEKITQDIKLQI